MRGLRKYIKKHGKHFTLELAEVAVPQRWKVRQVEEAINRKVWYNVTESTLGDIVYLVNLAGVYNGCVPFRNKSKCIDCALSWVGNIDCTEMAFQSWLLSLMETGKSFNFKEFI